MRSFFRRISPLTLILVPLKQHLGCCVFLPFLLKALAATAFAEGLRHLPHAELLLGLILLPLIVYACLKAEDWWKLRSHRKKTACQLGCCPEAPPIHHFARRFTLNLIIGMILVLVVYNYH